MHPLPLALIAFIRLGRPQFLVGGFLLYGLGAAVAVAGGSVLDPRLYLLGQAGISVVQLMTHYANDYFDLAADVANMTPTRWSGGSRVLPSGLLPPRLALGTAALLAVLGVALSVALIIHGGRGGLAAGATLLLAEALAWSYSAPPLVLHSRGWGEMTTAVVVTGLAPLCGFLLQSGGFCAGRLQLPTLAAALFPPAVLQFAMLLAIEFPDAAGDAIGGKRTLVVRLGGPRAAALWRVLLVVVYGSLPLLAAGGGLPALAVAGGALGLPIAAWQFWRLGKGWWVDPRRWESLGFWSVALLIVTAAGELAAFASLAMRR